MPDLSLEPCLIPSSSFILLQCHWLPRVGIPWNHLQGREFLRVSFMRKCSRKSQEESGGGGTEKEENPARLRNRAKSQLAQLQLISAGKVWEVPPSGKGVGELIPQLLFSIAKGLPQRMSTPRAHSSWDFQAK